MDVVRELWDGIWVLALASRAYEGHAVIWQ